MRSKRSPIAASGRPVVDIDISSAHYGYKVLPRIASLRALHVRGWRDVPEHLPELERLEIDELVALARPTDEAVLLANLDAPALRHLSLHGIGTVARLRPLVESPIGRQLESLELALYTNEIEPWLDFVYALRVPSIALSRRRQDRWGLRIAGGVTHVAPVRELKWEDDSVGPFGGLVAILRALPATTRVELDARDIELPAEVTELLGRFAGN
jgi:hypothetical protein